MNKNFIRFIKREIRSFFVEYVKDQGLKNSKKSYTNNCKHFALFLLENTSVEWGNIEGFNAQSLTLYLMALSQYCKFKSLAVTQQEIMIKHKVFNLLYSFSHTRFYSFIQIPEIRFLILIIKERYKMCEFIYKICHSHSSSYHIHINSLFKLIKIKTS